MWGILPSITKVCKTFHILNAQDPWCSLYSLCFLHPASVQSNAITIPVSNCHEGPATACHKSGFHQAVWAVFFNLQCHDTQIREETPRNVLLALFGNRIFWTPRNQFQTWLVLQDNYQQFRGGDMWSDCGLPSVGMGIINEIETARFLGYWLLSTALQLLMVLLSSSLLLQRRKSTPGINGPACSLKAWVNQKERTMTSTVTQRISGTRGAQLFEEERTN